MALWMRLDMRYEFMINKQIKKNLKTVVSHQQWISKKIRNYIVQKSSLIIHSQIFANLKLKEDNAFQFLR